MTRAVTEDGTAAAAAAAGQADSEIPSRSQAAGSLAWPGLGLGASKSALPSLSRAVGGSGNGLYGLAGTPGPCNWRLGGRLRTVTTLRRRRPWRLSA